MKMLCSCFCILVVVPRVARASCQLSRKPSISLPCPPRLSAEQRTYRVICSLVMVHDPGKAVSYFFLLLCSKGVLIQGCALSQGTHWISLKLTLGRYPKTYKSEPFIHKNVYWLYRCLNFLLINLFRFFIWLLKKTALYFFLLYSK